MPLAKLPLTASPHTTAFRALATLLRADPTLRKAVKTWFVWDGGPNDDLTPDLSTCPSLAIAPGAGPDAWLGPSGFTGDLVVELELWTAGTRVDDVLDLYHAVKLALYPADATARTAVRQALVAAGVQSGEPEFGGRATPFPVAGNVAMGLSAQIRLRLDLFLNP